MQRKKSINSKYNIRVMCWQVSFTIGGSNKSHHLFKKKKKKGKKRKISILWFHFFPYIQRFSQFQRKTWWIYIPADRIPHALFCHRALLLLPSFFFFSFSSILQKPHLEDIQTLFPYTLSFFISPRGSALTYLSFLLLVLYSSLLPMR